jgi:hypothetical protein
MKNTYNSILIKLVDSETKLKKLPPLTSVQKAKLDNSRAIDHLYYSSKIEGTTLNDKRLDKAIHGQI